MSSSENCDDMDMEAIEQMEKKYEQFRKDLSDSKSASNDSSDSSENEGENEGDNEGDNEGENERNDENDKNYENIEMENIELKIDESPAKQNEIKDEENVD